MALLVLVSRAIPSRRL